MEKMKYCPRFNEHLDVDNYEGDVCMCNWISPGANIIGNLMTDDIDKIYNSNYANYLRSTMDDQSFKLCNKDACPYLQNDSLEIIEPDEYQNRKKTSYSPDSINIAYDFVCNQSCETCRKEVFKPPSDYGIKMRTIHSKISPYLNNAKRISASGHGDPFASKYIMEVLENLHPQRADLELGLETNGVFLDEEHWARIEHLSTVQLHVLVTTNSFDEFTYKHISRGGDYKRIMRNLRFISRLRENGNIDELSHALVIQDRNFREIPSFIKRSFSDYAFDKVVLRPVYQWRNMDSDVYWFKDVLNPCHPYHEEYLEIMQDPSLQDERVYKWGGDMLHDARPYPGAGVILSVAFPYNLITKGSKIIIYGACGAIGREFQRQIMESQYCEVVGLIDRSGDNSTVMTPDYLTRLSADSYDRIILATKSTVAQDAMKQVLKEAAVEDERIICLEERI